MRPTDVARAIHCNVRAVRRLRRRYRETGQTADRPCSGRPRVTPAQDRYIRTSHLRDRYRMATKTARVTPGTHNPSISAQTVHNRLRKAGLRACRPVVRQILTRLQTSFWPHVSVNVIPVHHVKFVRCNFVCILEYLCRLHHSNNINYIHIAEYIKL